MAELCERLESILELAVREVFAETLVFCRNENGEESYKPIEEIEVRGTLWRKYIDTKTQARARRLDFSIFICVCMFVIIRSKLNRILF